MPRQPPKSPNLPLILSDDMRLKLDLTLVALRSIDRDSNWAKWMTISDGIMAVTTLAVMQAKSGPWHRDNKSAVRAFNQIWDAFQASEGDNFKPLSSTERSMLRFIREHPEVEVWRGTLDSTKRRSLNHPNAVVTAWRKATQTPDKEKVRKAKEKADVVVALETELADVKKRLMQAERNVEWAAPDTLAKAEDAVVAQLNNAGIANKIASAKRLLSRLGIADLNKALAKQPAKKRNKEREKTMKVTT
jgi:hypothetical protein